MKGMRAVALFLATFGPNADRSPEPGPDHGVIVDHEDCQEVATEIQRLLTEQFKTSQDERADLAKQILLKFAQRGEGDAAALAASHAVKFTDALLAELKKDVDAVAVEFDLACSAKLDKAMRNLIIAVRAMHAETGYDGAAGRAQRATQLVKAVTDAEEALIPF